jgi:uncharacterized membrane protein
LGRVVGVSHDALARLRAVRDHRGQHRSAVNVVHHDEATPGERIADAAAAGIGSWRFLIVQTIMVLLWVSLNAIGLIRRWDPFPFILLNLLFSVQAAYTGPVLLLAGNRQAQKDRLTLEHACIEADKADQQNEDIMGEIKRNTEFTLQIVRHLGLDSEPAAKPTAEAIIPAELPSPEGNPEASPESPA